MPTWLTWEAVTAIATAISVIVAIGAFGFAIYTHFKSESKKTIEAAKIAMQKERATNSKYAIVNILRSIDAIIQIPKQGKITIEQMQNLARIARAQTVALANQLETEEKIMAKWKFGELVESDGQIQADMVLKDNQEPTEVKS